MKKILLWTIFFCTAQYCFAQAEMQRKMKDAQAEIDKMKNDPRYKDFASKLPTLDTSMKRNQQASAPANETTRVHPVNTDELPVKNTRLLSTLPKKTLTRTELVKFLNNLDGQLSQKMSKTSVDSAKRMISQCSNDGSKLSSAAMVVWYRNQPEAAVLMATRAATIAPDDNTSLNNCAAILSLAGLENKAIPIFQVLLQRLPKSSTLLNNIGQAYASLGELDTALYYFGRCVKIAPEHPEANNTAAMICAKKGQIETAKKYCVQALKGALTSGAVRTYDKLFHDNKIEDLIDIGPWKQYPFNEHDFTFPAQCEKITDALEIKAETKAYEKRYQDLAHQYEKGYQAEMTAKSQALSAKFASDPVQYQALANSETPFSRRAGYAYHKISSQLVEQITNLIMKHAGQIETLKKEFDEKAHEIYKHQLEEATACAQENLCQVKVVAKYCRLNNELADQYLPKFAVINDDYVSKYWRLNKELFEAFSVFIRMGLKKGTIQYYAEESTRIASLFSPLINGTLLRDGYELKYPSPLCGDLSEEQIKKLENLELVDKKPCNIDLEIPMGVAKLTISCDEFEFEGGELIKGKFNKNFKSGQTTLYVGVGASEDIPGFEAGATQYIFVSFDKNNQPVDAGTQGELELDVKGVTKGDQKVILKVGMNTGANLDAGPLKPLADVLPYAFK
jgi:tetratricopeptide (TPR) repeat protein